MKVDPITFAVIKSGLDSIADDMAYTVVRIARSEIVTDPKSQNAETLLARRLSNPVIAIRIRLCAERSGVPPRAACSKPSTRPPGAVRAANSS